MGQHGMKHLVGVMAAITALTSSSSAMATAAVPAADYTFNFSGQCSDCVGTGAATLNVTNYVPGAALDNSNFVSFSYAGTDLLAAYSFNTVDFFSGNIDLAPGFYNVSIIHSPYQFLTNTEGDWSTTGPVPVDMVDDFGLAGTWSGALTTAGVPEPATWAMMLAGFGLIGAAMRRRKAYSAKVSYAFT